MGYPFVDGDIHWEWAWTSSSVWMYMAWAFGAGVVAGLVGIGGGMVLGPLMLQMNVLPQVNTFVVCSPAVVLIIHTYLLIIDAYVLIVGTHVMAYRR